MLLKGPAHADRAHIATKTIHLKRTIETGRRHQIRVGLANLGHPVIGDQQHGAEGNPIGRIALHASSLEFLHPETDDPVRFEAPIPFGPEH